MAFTGFRDLDYVGLVKQSAQGSGAAATVFPRLASPPKFTPIQDVGEYRDGSSEHLTFHAKKSIKYLIEVPFYWDCDIAAPMLAWYLGADAVTGAGDPYTHTITYASILPYLSIARGVSQNSSGTYTILERVTDCKPLKLEIGGNAGKEILGKATFIGSTSSIPSADTVVLGSEGPGMFGATAFTLAGPTEASTLQAQLQSFKVVIDRGTKEVFGPNQLTPIGVFEGQVKVSLDFEAVLAAATLYKLTNYGGNAGTVPAAALGGGTLSIVTTVSTNHDITLTLGAFDYIMADPDMNADGTLAMVKVATAPFKSGSTQPLAAVVRTAVATDFA